MMRKEIQREYGLVAYEDDVLYSYINENVVLTPEIVEDINRIGFEYSEGRMHFSLADLRANVTSTKEARAYAADNKYMANHIAYSILGNSLPVILVANFFINIHKPKIMTRLFKTEKEALEWFEKIREKRRKNHNHSE